MFEFLMWLSIFIVLYCYLAYPLLLKVINMFYFPRPVAWSGQLPFVSVVIAAYNTGPGNVLRTFSKKQDTAVNEINRLHPGALYDKLRESLPYEETRRYLVTVTGYRKQFVSIPAAAE